MPIYEYHCRECGAKFDKLVSMSTRDADVQCPSCQKKAAEKVLSMFASSARGGATSASAGHTSCSTSFHGG